jgi:hypothetical protein
MVDLVDGEDLVVLVVVETVQEEMVDPVDLVVEEV